MKKMKKFGILLVGCMLIIAMLFGVSACAGDETGDDGGGNGGGGNGGGNKDPIAVTAVELNRDEIELMVGATFTLTAKVTPDDATNPRVSWKSSDSEIATVSNGRVTAVSGGTATITVTTADGNKTDSCIVTVTTIETEGIMLSAKSMTLAAGEQGSLTATVIPDNATDAEVVWTSSVPEVAKINAQSGKITALGEGQTVIRAATSNGKYYDECTVTVTAREVDYKGYTEIDSIEDWNAINNNLSGKYVLTADIDFGNRQVNTIGNPRGGKQADFNGIIDGNGYAIKNAHFVSGGTSDAGVPNNSYSGMVATLGNNGIVRNISLIDCSTKGEAYNAMLVVWNHGLIENCYVQGSVGNDNTWWDGWTLGGVLVNINQGIMHDCVSWSKRDGITYGLVGSNYTEGGVYNCYVVRDETISDWAISGNINGNGVTQQPLIDCAYIEIGDAKTAASYPALNTYFWQVEDGKIPYVKNSEPEKTIERDWTGPSIGEVEIVPEVSLNVTEMTVEVKNGAAMLKASVSPIEAAELDGVEIAWTSDNEEFATVEGDGYSAIVRFKAAGTVKITVTVKYGDYTDTAFCTITITE